MGARSFAALLFAFASISNVESQPSGNQAVDLTRVAGQSGADVTQTVVDLIRDELRGVFPDVFPDDNNLLRRIACVESKDGTDPNTYRDGYNGGIWQVDLIGFLDTQNTQAHPGLVARYTAIQAAFGIDWPSVQWADLRMPLYSGLAARLFLVNIPQEIPGTANIADQAQYWKQYYNTPSGAGTVERFIEEANMCDECEVEGIDLAFVMDGSGSVGSADFGTAKEFVSRVAADGFTIGPSNTKVAVIQYSSSAIVEFDFNEHSDSSSLQQAIMNIRYRGGGTATGRAITLMTNSLFTTASGAREPALNIPRIGVVITDGRSGDSVSGPADAARAANITMFAIGVAGFVQSELNQIANSPASQFSFEATNFGEIDNIRSLVGTAACRVPAAVEINTDINGTLRPNSVRYASYPVPDSRRMTLKLTTPTGAGAIAYFSIRVRNPSAAFYDWKLETFRFKRFDQLFIDFDVNVVGRRRKRQAIQGNLIYATVVNKATPVDPVPGVPTPSPGDLDTSFNLIGEEGNTLVPEPTTAPQEFPCGPNTQCANNGLCRFQAGASASNYVCQCRSCYSGQRCEIDSSGCANFACQNGAQCTPFSDSCGQVFCDCQPCFYGRFCESRIDACANHRCQNGAVCVSPTGTCRDYQCVCAGCYTGPFCDIPMTNPCDQNPCQNGGACSPCGNCYSYECQCPNGYSGVNCELARTTNLNLCNNFPCQNGGSCMSMHNGGYTCICRAGWRGQDCGTPADPTSMPCLFQTCLNGGSCYETYSSTNQFQGTTCVCASGFTGPQCAAGTSILPADDACAMNPGFCDNGGVCNNAYIQINFGSAITLPYCSCPVGYIGQHCEIRHYDPCGSGPCLNGGRCTPYNNYFTCQCLQGYEGTTCATTVAVSNPCDSSPCVFGTCFQAIGGLYYCQCNSGYTGTRCNIPVTSNPCSPNPCTNGGACTVSGTSFTCQCPAGYVGNTCSTPGAYGEASSGSPNSNSTAPPAPDIDIDPPELAPPGCPQNIAQVAPLGQLNAIVTWNEPMARLVSEVQSSNQEPFGQGVSRLFVQVGGAIKMEYSFTDYAGNTAVCAFAISVSSPQGPRVTGCPTNMRYEISSGQQSQRVIWNPPTSDPGVPVNPSRHQSGSEFRRGTTLITYTFGSGMDLTVCAFIIEVADAVDVCATRTPCQNGGQCQGSGRNFQCVCPAGYSGSLCESQSCSFNRCLNGGTCTVTTTGTGYTCTCLSGYSGDNCQISVPPQALCNPNPCQNGGTCTQPATGRYFCTCPPGYSGVNCQQVSNPCASNPCRNGGACSTTGIGYTCQCPPGFTGRNCENTATGQSCSNNPCLNGGTCTSLTSGYLCRCLPSFTGDRCQLISGNVCNPSPCLYGGACSVTATGYVCNCPTGYTGVNCEIVPGQSCNNIVCFNGGTCTTTTTTPGYTCTCLPNYTGVFCQTFIVSNPCASNPCRNGGVCSTTGIGYTCQCPSGFTGRNCESTATGPIRISNCPSRVEATMVNANARFATVSWTLPNAVDSLNQPLNPVMSTYPAAQTQATVNVGNALLVEYWYTDRSGNMDMCAFPITASAPNGPPIDPSSCPPPDLAAVPSNPRSFRWTPPRSIGSGVTITSTALPGNQFNVGNTLVKYVFTFGDPRVNPSLPASVCAFVVTVSGVPGAVGRRKKDVHSDDPYDVCRGFPCDSHHDDSTCVPCVRRYDDVYGYACVEPTKFNESLDITCNEIQRPQHGYHIDESHDTGIPRDSNDQSSLQLSPVALTAIITVVVCLGIVLLVIGAFIIYPVLRNSKEFQQRISDYEAKTKYQKVSTVY